MAHTCISCQLPVRKEEGSVQCSECSCKYHFGKCAGIAEKSFKTKSESAKTNWRCQTCRNAGARGAHSEADTDVLVAINQKLESLPALVAKVSDMEKSLQFMSGKFDEFEQRIIGQDTEIKALRTRVTELEEKDMVNTTVQSELQRQVNDLEFRSRRLNLEVHGVPVVPGENLLSSLDQIADTLRVPRLTDSDVASAHRLPAKQDKVPGIIIRFAKQQTRDNWLQKKNALKNTEPKVFIQENLTHYHRELFRATKDKAKEKGYAFVWYANGKVLVRKASGRTAMVIRSKDDLEKL